MPQEPLIFKCLASSVSELLLEASDQDSLKMCFLMIFWILKGMWTVFLDRGDYTYLKYEL